MRECANYRRRQRDGCCCRTALLLRLYLTAAMMMMIVDRGDFVVTAAFSSSSSRNRVHRAARILIECSAAARSNNNNIALQLTTTTNAKTTTVSSSSSSRWLMSLKRFSRFPSFYNNRGTTCTSGTALAATIEKTEEEQAQAAVINATSLSSSPLVSTTVTATTTTIMDLNEETVVVNGSFESVSSSSSSIIQPQPQLTTTTNTKQPITMKGTIELLEQDTRLQKQMADQAAMIVTEMMDENCEINPETSLPLDELCIDDVQNQGFRNVLQADIERIGQLVTGRETTTEMEVASSTSTTVDAAASTPAVAATKAMRTIQKMLTGDALEKGWETRAKSSALRRNAEVWKFALQSVFRVLKPRKLRKKGATDVEIKTAQIEAATFIRDGLLDLGPSFVKLGQVLSTRTDVLPTTYTDILKTLTDNVPGFDGRRAKQIVSAELGRPCDEIFQNFSRDPIKAASLGQVHTATYKGKKVAIKVQRAGLKELFDLDLKNLKKLAILLDKFDPKSDGADRDWVSIYEESERLLYLEIDYLNEVKNAERFANDFKDIDWVRIPGVYKEVTTPRVLTMEFVESFKLTDTKRVEKEGLDRKLLSKRVADSFLRQIVETAYFHADPHSGNLCVNKEGQLVFYDFGQMDELKPNVRRGFRTFCTALFAGGPMISDTDLARNAKDLVKGVEQAGVLSKGADTLAVEKLARYFMRSFKDSQLGKSSGNIKETVGADLQTLTENNSFRFPSTFTFVFRAFVSVEGIGKELDPDFDIGKLAQPFLEKFIDDQKGYSSPFEKNLDIFKKATGLNSQSIDTALTQPRKVAYIEETIRAMESGNLKIRVRSLENEKSLERLGLRHTLIENLMLSSILLNVAGLATRSLFRNVGIAGACYFLLQAFISNAKIKKFDKTQLKYVNTDFQEAGDTLDDAN